MNVNHAVLHTIDLQGNATAFSQRELDLSDKPTRSYVQRHLRKIDASAESRHGEFTPQSSFAGEFEHYLKGGQTFLEFADMIGRFLYEELRKGEQDEGLDILVADYEADAEKPASPQDGQDEPPARRAGEAAGPRRFAVLLLPRRQTFAHDIRLEAGQPAIGLVRHDATLPGPTQKVDSYCVVDAAAFTVDFCDHPRLIAGQELELIPGGLLQCTSHASTRQVVEKVQRIVEDVAREYGSNPAVAAARAKAYVNDNACDSEYLAPWEMGDDIFEDEPRMRDRFEEMAREEDLPREVPVKRAVARRMGRSHSIRTDTGIELTFPSEYSTSTEFMEFTTHADGSITIELKNIGSIENRR